MLAAGAALTKNLFLFNAPLRNALFVVRELSGPLTSLGMLSIPCKDTFDIHDFIIAQSKGMLIKRVMYLLSYDILIHHYRQINLFCCILFYSTVFDYITLNFLLSDFIISNKIEILYHLTH